MASIHLQGTLVDSLGEIDVGAIMTFTHLTNTGETIATTKIDLIIPPDGSYSIDVEYGQIRIDYTTRFTERFIATVIVNQDSTAKTIPELLNAAVPESDAVILEMQTILADAVTAEDNASDSADAAAASAILAADAATGVSAINAYQFYTRDRAPSRKDIGLPVGGNFRWNFNGSLYVKTRENTSSWVGWTEDKNIYAPFYETVSGALALYFTKLINPSYTGDCINVTNTVTLGVFDIGFDSSGNLDAAALKDALKEANGVINTWYDQSGNGNNATSTGSNRPFISPTPDDLGNYNVVFEATADYNGATTEQFLLMPAGVTGQTDDVTMGAFTGFRNTIRNCPLIELAGADSKFSTIGKRSQTGVDGLLLSQNQSFRVIDSYQPSITPGLIVGSLTPSSADLYYNGNASDTGTSTSSITYTGGKIGSTTNTYVDGISDPVDGGSFMTGAFVLPSGTALLDYRRMWFSLMTDLNVKPQKSGKLIFDGDSITEGAFSRFSTDYPHGVSDRLDIKPDIYSVAISGGTITTQNAGRSKWEGKLINQNNPFNIVSLAIGTNDIGSGDTDAQVWSGITTYVAAVNLLGYEVVLSTVLPRTLFNGNPTMEGYRLALNDRIRDDFLLIGAIAVIDYELEGTMGITSFASNTLYYQDGTHPTPLGQNLLATYSTNQLEPILNNRLNDFYK